MRRTILLAASLWIAAPAAAQAPVPPALQAQTFDKIFAFDRALGDRSRVKVLLVHPEGAGGATATTLQRAFGAAGIVAEPVALPAAIERLRAPAPGLVVYLLPGTATPELLAAAATARALTIAGEAAMAEQGKASIGLALRGDKAEIVVNFDRVEREGHDFSAQLLQFARVVRGTAGGGAAPAPVLVGLTKPQYPSLARRFKVEGDVVMRLAVDQTGKVTAVELVKGLGRGGVDEAAVAAARSARFRPATRDGTPVASTYLLTIPFRL
jgi:TonB family protein